MTGDQFKHAAYRAGRNKAPEMLYDAARSGLLDVAEYPEVVADAWSGAEFPTNFLDADVWVDLFTTAGFTRDGVVSDRPDEPVTVYRGCHHGRRFGMSWTTDLDRARWFATRDLGSGPGNVYALVAQPGDLLAFIHGSSRGEAEYVIDTIGLEDGDVKVVAE